MEPERGDDGDNPYEPPQVDEMSVGEAPEAVDLSFRDAKSRVLIWMVVLYGACGILMGIISAESGFLRVVDMATWLCFAVLLLQWCSLDRAERQLDPWPHFVLMIVICPGPFIIMPIYLCRTRGWGGLAATLKAGLFFALLIGVAVVGVVAGALVTDGPSLFLVD